MITYQTAFDIASAHQEIQRAEKMLKETQEAISRRQQPDIRDAFGRQQVEWSLCVPVLRAHIGQMEAKLMALNELARSELDATCRPIHHTTVP